MLAVIDGNNIAFGIWATFARSRQGFLTSSVGINTTLPFGMLRTLNALVDKYSFDQCIICWDTGGKTWRNKLWEGYKAERKTRTPPFDMDEYHEHLKEVRNFFSDIGLSQLAVKGIEADDLVGYLCYNHKSDKSIIISDDKDYYQLLRRTIKQYRPSTNTIYTENMIKEEFGLNKCSDYAKLLALTGDKDEVPGLCGIGPKKAVKLLDENNWSIKEFVNNDTGVYSLKRGEEKLPLKELEPSRFTAYKLAKIRTLRKHYSNSELKKIDSELEKNDKRTVQLSKLNQINSLMDFKNINMAYILRKLGVNVIGKGKVRKSRTGGNIRLKIRG